MNLIDLHCDTASRIHRNRKLLYKNNYHISLEKLHKYENYAQIMALFIPNKLSNTDGYYRFFENYGYYMSQIVSNSDNVEFVTNSNQISEAWHNGKHAFLLSVEDARILDNDITRLDVLYQKGVRFLVLMWSGETCIGGSHNTTAGLTDFGKAVTRRCFDLGIVPDISHSSEQTASDIIEIALEQKRTIIASHSNSYSVYPHSRNLRDVHFKFIADTGGIVGVSLCRSHLGGGDSVGITDIMKHIEHYLELGGENTVALGCDLDGTDLPDGFEDIRDLTVIADHMAKNNYQDELINKLFWGNAKRFFEQNICKDGNK